MNISQFQKDKIKKVAIYVFLSFLAILFVSPLYILIVNSFKPNVEIIESPLSLPSDFTFQYIKEAFVKIDFFRSFFNSLLITIISVLLMIVVSSLAAWMLVRNKTKASTVIFLALVSALLIPFQAIMYPLLSIFDALYLKNQLGLIIMYGGFGVATTTFLYHGFIKSIPPSLEEAAFIDGASTFQVYRNVILPLIKPITVTVAILNTMWVWNDFLLPFMTIGTNEAARTLPLSLYFARIQAGQYGNPWTIIFPSVLIAVIPAVLFFFSLQKHIVKGITAGSVK